MRKSMMDESNEDSNEMEEETQPVPADVFAKDVFVLMQKGCRVSRNVRASWYFKHLNSKIQFKTMDELPNDENDLSLVSVIPSDGVKMDPEDTYNVCMQPHTFVTFLASIYRLAFILDISPSVVCVDLFKNQVMYDDLLNTLNNCIRGLVKPFQIPGSNVIFQPDLYVTIMLQTPVIQSKDNQVLVQGIQINEKNVEEILTMVKEKLKVFEKSLYVSTRNILMNAKLKTEIILEDDGETEDMKQEIKEADDIMSPEAGFVNMLRYGILSLQLLPENSSAGLIVITDGLVGLPEANLFESLLTQLRNSTISCSFLKIGSNQPNHQQFGHVAHVELMQFIATATFGTYIASCPQMDNSSGMDPNIYHKALFFWNFQKGLEGFKYELTHKSDEDVPGSLAWINRQLYSRPLDSKRIGLDNVRKKHVDSIVNANISSVLSLRLREGYTIREVQLTKGGTVIEVKLVLPWREYVRVEYVAVASWPIDSISHKTYIEVHIEGSYSFLHEISCQRSSLPVQSLYRVANVRRFWRAIQSINETDKKLTHLQSFSTNSNYYKIPNSIRNGVPLFVTSVGNTNHITLNSQLSASDNTLTTFATFWKHILLMDTHVWQKWMHCHRIGLALEHDMPLPKYLHIPNSSGRFHTIASLQALTRLTSTLREWSTFVLKENMSYIKLLFNEPDKPPSYFCVLRATLKGPCILLRLAFLGGTPSKLRKSEVESLTVKIKDLKFPPRGNEKVEKKRSQGSGADGSKVVKRKTPLMRDWSEINCCILFQKPIDKILISYERVPRDMMTVDDPSKEDIGQPSSVRIPMSNSAKSATSMFRMLSHYLCHQRWIWTVQQSFNIPVEMPFIGKLLQTLTKLRLQEGFHFAAAASGVVSFVLEVDMTAPENYVKGDPTREYENCSKCVVQYVIFPPHTKTTRDCEVDDDIEEMETTESEFELQVVTECWTEPQYGVCVNNTPECKHLDGLTASEIAKAFFPVDYECISSLVTYDHLVYLCQNKIAVPYSEECERSASDSLINGHSSPKKSPPGNESLRNDSAPQCIPFPFDLLSLLPWSQQAELLFSTFLMEVHGDVKDPIQMKATNNVLFSILLEDIGEFHDKQVSMSVEDCEKFLKLVKNRERDFTQNPLPFNFGAEDPASTVPENFPGDEPEGAENFLTPERPSDKECHSETISQQASLDIPDIEETNKAIPRWVCFAKASEDGNLSLTFVPASFDDLLLLNKVVLPEPVPEPEELLPEVTIQEPSLSEDNQDSLKEECTSENNVEEASEEEKDGKIAQKIPVLQRLDSEDPSSVSSSKEEEVAEWIKTNTQQTHSKSLLIPIYTYSCCQNYISDSLIQKMDYRLPQDKFEDMSFEVDECSEKYDKTSVSPRTHLSSMMESDDSQKEDDSYYSKRGMMTLDSRSRDHRRAAINAFKLTRRNICRIFFACYVKGVFKSLQQGLCINEHDLDNAINNICEESLPLETEITAFLHSSCSHLQHLVNRARKVMSSAKDEPDQPRRLSVRFEGLPIEDSESESDAGERIPVILQFPKTSISLSNLVALEQQCEQSPGLGLFIAEKFLEITKKWFRPVPSNPDYYYYFPEDISHIHLEDLEEEGNLTDTSDDSIEDLDQGEDEDRLIFGDMDITVRQLDEDGCSMSCSLESSNDDEEDLDRTPESVQFDDVPLFIHFTCTLKNRLEQYNVSARTLPHCISQILSLKDEDIKEFDLSNLKFTFDINCLTLPTDHENEAFNKKSLIRMLSSNSSAPSNHVDLAEADMSIVSSDQSRIKDGLGDPISHLQKKQYKSMMVFKQEIEWLLNDEIVSSLRHLSPITADTLEFVTRHIKKYKEEDRPGCDHLVINLNFVFGENKSLVPFTEEFERLKLPNYSLTKEGDYYFVILNRSHSIDMIQAMEITKALQLVAEIEEDGQDPSKIYTKIEERSNSLPTLFPLKNSADLSASNVQEESEESDDEDEESATLRPRSKSDAKFLRRSISGLSEEVTSPTQTLNEIQQALPLFSTDTIPEPTAQPPGKLKKSCSFASFETSVVVTNSETLPSAQPQPLKSGILPTTMDRVRNRHFSAPSGPGTPQSRSSTLPQTPSWISSRGSCNEDGYDGGSSNEEQDDSHSVSDAGHNNHPLPNFWLILQIHPDKAEIFFHARDITVRDLTEEELREKCERRFLPSHIKNDIQNICKRVNQRLLLQDLSETRQCNDLLMATADEDHMWADKRTTSGRSIVDSTASEGDDDESEDGQGKRYLAARLEFMPGHFSCECVWKTLFVLHTRLKELTRRGGGASRGLMSIRTVLNKLAVINRKNMFVIKETDTQNVFYLRLRELKDVQVAATTSGNMLEDDYFVQEEPSFKDMKTMGAKSDEVKSVSKMDVDTISNFSGYSRLSSRLESVVELLVFGIEEPGHEIKDSLVRALQTKLDEAVLDVISLTLSRNPKCKLKAEDVRFIQNTEEVSKVIQLSIPPSAMMYLFALMYYLRQNLLQFLHTPNYDGNEPEDHFRDVVNGEFEAIKPENVFLFIRPPAVGKGIACISLSLADYTGSPVKLLNCPYPSVMKNCVIPTTEEFEIMTHTAQHDPFTDKSRPGPTALIQFKIWDRFNSNSEMKYLTEKLVAAVKHALCDVVLEYNLLTAPICHIPRSHDESELIQTSVPSSPVSPKGNMDRRHSVIGKRLSDSLSLKPVIQSASPLQSLKNLIPSKGRFSTPPPQSSPMFEFPEDGSVSAEISAIQRDVSPPNSAIKEVRMMYESGQRGNLHTVYPSVLIPFTAFCSKQGTPSVNKFELSLLSEFSVDFVLKEIQSILPTIIHNLTFNLFKLVDKPGELLSGVHYFPGRSPIQPAEDNMETSLDAARKKVPVEMYSPGFLLLGRDVEQWRTVVMHENNDSDFPGTKILTNQKFQPYIFMDQDSTDALAHFRAEQDFVPRQNLVLISVQGKQITIATYNLASDLYSSLESHITKLVQWHNARAHLLDSVFSQKMGLFHHKTFSGLTYTLEQNPYTQSTFEKELLIKNLAPPRDNQRRHGSISVRDRNYTHIIDPIAQFDYIYKDQQPHVPLHKNSKIPAMKDPVYVHGVQALEIRNLSIKAEEKFNKLTELHASWMQKTSGNSSANEDHLKLLKQSSRLFHYCATPLLFSSQWRHRVVEKTNPQTKQEPSVASTPPSSDIPKSRSRHSSGASVASLKTKRSESQDGRKKATTPQDSPEVRQGSQEELWHVELRVSFSNQYISYLQNLGFKKINVQSSSKKRISKIKSSDGQVYLANDDASSGIICLQKTLTGGIILMEIGYREEFFCVKMFVFDYTQIGIGVNQQMRLLFVDECQKYKGLIHVHSFAHDFHLRCIQRYISGEDQVFHPGFHLTNFLSDFSQIYSYPPSFSRNCLQHETVVFQHSLCSSQVFEYMIKQMKDYDMKVVKMKAFCDYDVEPDYCFVKNDEFALVRTHKLTTRLADIASSIKDADDYDVGFIITKDSTQSLKQGQDSEKAVLRLKYFVLLTRRTDCFPIKNLDTRFGVRPRLNLPTESVLVEPPETERVRPVPVKRHIGVRQEMVDYLGYSNKHQTSIYNLLCMETKVCRREMEDMVEKSKNKCRQDLLWKRMLLDETEEDAKKRKKTDIDDVRDTSLVRLSYEEFQELLDMVERRPLSGEDAQLIPLSNMPLQWYQSLVPVLIAKYSSQHRSFISADGQNQCILILNANFLGMFIMLEITANKAELCCVIQDQMSDPQEHSLMSPNFSLISMQSHIEDFVNTCCFHLWSTMLL